LTLLERIDARINRLAPPVLHLTSKMCSELIIEDLKRCQNGDKQMRFGVDHETGEQFYRGIPIKIVGTGLRLD
jgi:hypothetical protein